MKNCHHHHHDACHTPLPPKCIKWFQTATTMKKATRVWRRGQGLKMQTCLEPQVCFLYYFIDFLNYTNVLQVQQWRTATMMFATHHSHLNASNDPKTEMTMKKATRFGRRAPGMFFYCFIHFLNYTNVLQVPQQRRTTTTTTVMLATHQSHFEASN